MFRDSRGVVHTVSSADPLADLPPGAARALQRALLAPADGQAVDLGSILERCDAVRELVERWQDAFFASLPDDVDLVEETRYAAEAGISLDEVETGSGDDEDDGDVEVELAELDELVELTEPAEDDPRTRLPEELVTVLERELLLLPLRVRLEALVAAADLVSGWSELVSDHEKLLGHLVLAHAEPQQACGHEHLVDRHAVLHVTGGPGHP
ncbi:MAG: hypothetical protein ACR2K2_05740 [Mycobacteriales bacterium]